MILDLIAGIMDFSKKSIIVTFITLLVCACINCTTILASELPSTATLAVEQTNTMATAGDQLVTATAIGGGNQAAASALPSSAVEQTIQTKTSAIAGLIQETETIDSYTFI